MYTAAARKETVLLDRVSPPLFRSLFRKSRCKQDKRSTGSRVTATLKASVGGHNRCYLASLCDEVENIFLRAFLVLVILQTLLYTTATRLYEYHPLRHDSWGGEGLSSSYQANHTSVVAQRKLRPGYCFEHSHVNSMLLKKRPV